MIAVGLVLVLLYPIAVSRRAVDFYGSDDYWYAEDVETLMRGDSATTHEVYPFSLIGSDGRFQERRPFVHNLPVLRLWALAGRVTGSAFAGARLVNIVSALLTGVFVFLGARRFTGTAGALVAGVFVLYIPVSFASSGRLMPETFAATCVALAWCLAVNFPQRLGAVITAQLVMIVAALGRIWTLPLLLVIPFVLLFDERQTRGVRLFRIAVAMIAGASGYIALSRHFPSYMPQLDLATLLEVSHGNNIQAYYRLEPLAARPLGESVSVLTANAWSSLRLQFTWTREFPLPHRLPANLAVAISGAGWFAPGSDRFRRYAIAGSIVAFGSYLGMTVLFQNFPRYAIPPMPVLVVGAAVALDRFWGAERHTKLVRAAIVVLLVALMAAFGVNDEQLIKSGRADALVARQARETAHLLVDNSVPNGARIALDVPFGTHWPIDSALQPRPVLMLASDFPFNRNEYVEMFDRFEPTLVIAGWQSRLPDYFDLVLVHSENGTYVYEGRNGQPPRLKSQPQGPIRSIPSRKLPPIS